MSDVKYPKLRIEMSKRGDTQEKLAKLLEISIASVNRRLQGKTRWTIGDIEKICERYGKDYYELFK